MIWKEVPNHTFILGYVFLFLTFIFTVQKNIIKYSIIYQIIFYIMKFTRLNLKYSFYKTIFSCFLITSRRIGFDKVFFQLHELSAET
jgi:hypothetical protein